MPGAVHENKSARAQCQCLPDSEEVLRLGRLHIIHPFQWVEHRMLAVMIEIVIHIQCWFFRARLAYYYRWYACYRSVGRDIIQDHTACANLRTFADGNIAN